MAQLRMTPGSDALQAWYEKYKWNTWRPVVGIQEGSPGIPANKTWVPYGSPTSNNDREQYNPPFPAYPSCVSLCFFHPLCVVMCVHPSCVFTPRCRFVSPLLFVATHEIAALHVGDLPPWHLA